MTMIIVTHEMQSAFQIADRMCMLDRGRIIAVGSAEEIRKHPHPRVRQFLQRIPDAFDEGSSSYITGFAG